MNTTTKFSPLVSVIIPCYNHAAFLAQAVESILVQKYKPVEIIVVNDGSTDGIDEVMSHFKEIIYISQQNKGLSAARNTGIKTATGTYLLFLDADDFLLPGSISFQVKLMQENEKVAFVSGAHIKTDEQLNTLEEVRTEISKDHFLNLLQGNYIGMHAAVLYRRSVFNEFTFDTTLKAVEDYDLYLNVAARYPVLHHTQVMALYRQHSDNMSANLSFMLENVLKVLARQKPNLHSAEEKAAYQNGLKVWKDYYCGKIVQLLSKKRLSKNLLYKKELLVTLWKYRPNLYIRALLH